MQVSHAGGQALPQPDADSQAHSERVAGFQKQQLEMAGGSLSFADFMHHALYAPGLGYYVAGARKFGVDGDFVTAPEIAPVFSRVLGRQLAGVLQQFADDEQNILEIGAGSGALAVDVLGALSELEYLPATYQILEVSPELALRQREAISDALPQIIDRVCWVDRFPTEFCGVVIANEVLDALPVERFRKQDGQVLRDCVTASKAGFEWQSGPAPDNLRAAVAALEADVGPFADGYVSEVCIAAEAWISELAASLKRAAVFLFDYGVSQREYYAPDRHEGWLRCYFRHRMHNDPLILTGIQDLTSWVNFTQIAGCAVTAGLQVDSYASQAHFLLSGGLQEEILLINEMPTAAQIELSRQVKVLTMPGEMGENIKLLALSTGDIEVPDVLLATDRAHTL